MSGFFSRKECRPPIRRRFVHPTLERLESRSLLDAGQLQLVTHSGVGFDFNHDDNNDVVTHDRLTGNLFVDLTDADGRVSFGKDDTEQNAQYLGTHFIGQLKGQQWHLKGAGAWLSTDPVSNPRTDLLWENSDTGEVLIMRMDDIAIATPTPSNFLARTPQGATLLGVGDFDNNGYGDLLWKESDGDLALWLMSGSNREQTFTFSAATFGSYRFVAAGDLNGDHQADFLMEDDATRTLYGYTVTRAGVEWNYTFTVDPAVEIGSLADPVLDFQVGGVTYLNSGGISNILVRAQNNPAQANFVDWNVTAWGTTPAVTKREIYSWAPIRAAFRTSDAIASQGIPSAYLPNSDQLVAITRNNPNLTWRFINGQPYVLLTSWTNFNFTGRETAVPSGVYLWTSAGYELKDWYRTHDVAYEDLYQRTSQLDGLPADFNFAGQYKTHFTEFWVSPNSVKADEAMHASLWRPTPNPDYRNTSSSVEPAISIGDPSYPTWYNNWKQNSSYEPPDPAKGNWPGGYPWTRLGYTYDWGGDPYDNVGVSEFIIPEGTGYFLNDSIKNDVYWSRIYGSVAYVTAARPVRHYTDANGDIVTVSLTGPGTVELVLPRGGMGDAVAINTTATTAQSSLTIEVRQAGNGNGRTVVGNFKVGTLGDRASLGSLLATEVNLKAGGEIIVSGQIGSLHLGKVLPGDASTPAHYMLIGGSVTSRPPELRFGQVSDMQVTSFSPIGWLSATNWLETGNNKNSIKAPWIGTLKVAGNELNHTQGNFAGDITLTAGNAGAGVALNQFLVVGAITRGNVTVQDANGDGYPDGRINTITAARWDVGSLSGDRLAELSITGNRSYGMKGDFGANVTLAGHNPPNTLAALGLARIAGDLKQSIWRINSTVQQFIVSGTADHSKLYVSGTIQQLKLGATQSSDFLAGINLVRFGIGSRRHAEVPADFLYPAAYFRSIVIAGWAVPAGQASPRFMSDSSFSAPNFGTVSLLNAKNGDAHANDMYVLGSRRHISWVQYRDTVNPAKNWFWQPGQPWPGTSVLQVI